MSNELFPPFPKVSVIVPTLNVAHYLPGCLDSVKANQYSSENVEIVIIDNGSSDATREIARKYTDKVFVYETATIAALRNRGAEHAEGEVLAFIDSDCLADPGWLRAGVRTVTEEKCVGGSLYEIPIDAVWLERDWFTLRSRGRTETTHTGAGNLFITKALFNEVGGFDEKLTTGEDTEFCARVSKIAKVISNEEIKAIHLGNPKTLYQFFRREMWYGLGAFGSFRVNRFDKPLWGTIAFLLLTICQLAGILAFGVGWGSWLFIGASIGILSLLLCTVAYRYKWLNGVGHAVRLLLLYYVFYLGRSVALFCLLFNREYYHNIKSK